MKDSFTLLFLSCLCVLLFVALMMTLIDGKNVNPTKIEKTFVDNHVGIVRIGDCQYLKSKVYMGYNYTHKGDCDNPIHIYR